MTRCKFVCCVFVVFGMVAACSANMYNNRAQTNKYNDQMQKNANERIFTGPNPSTLPYEKRAQRLPDPGPYNGRGMYNPDSWPMPTEYIGQDGTILYCDKKGNVYDSNGVRYGKRTTNGQLRKLNKGEQLYDAIFSPNYAVKAFKAEEEEFENDNKSKKNPKSSFEDDVRKVGGTDVQKQLKAMGDGGDDIDVSFNSTVDEWRDDDDIASAALVYSNSQDWKNYVKILNANIEYLEQVLKEGKGDASLANLQKEEMDRLNKRINDTVFNAKGWNKKDAARVMRKMHEDCGIGGKLRRRLVLMEEVNKRGLFARTENLPNESQVGVRGWCHCWDNSKDGSFDNVEWIGNDWQGKVEGSETVYWYMICIDCGRCYTTAKAATAYSRLGADILDIKLHRVWEAKLSGVKSCAEKNKIINEMDRMLGLSRDRLLAIPDGQIVIRGSCKCKQPAPLRVGLKSREFSVCDGCGKVYKPL